jgi:hypothetical protein
MSKIFNWEFMKAKHYFLTVLISATIGCVQANEYEKNLSMQIGGLGLGVSVNLEQEVFYKNTNTVMLGIGVGYMPLFVNGGFSAGTFSFVAGGKYIKKFSHHRIVAGLSNSLAVSITSGVNEGFEKVLFNYLFSPDVGYRYLISPKNGIFVGAAYSPVCSFSGLSVANKPIQYKNYYYLLIGFSI